MQHGRDRRTPALTVWGFLQQALAAAACGFHGWRMDAHADQHASGRWAKLARLSGWQPGAGTLLLAGACSGLALPPLGLWPVLAATIPALLWHVERLAPRAFWRAFRAGLIFGFGYFVVAFHWIGVAFFVNPADIWMMPIAVGGLALFMACYWAMAVMAACAISARLAPRWLVVLIGLAVAEWLRGRLFTGFPWAVPGLVADGMGDIVQLASLVGMNGLTLLILIWAALPLVIWTQWTQSRRIGPAAAVALLLVPVSEGWGLWRIANHPVTFDGPSIVRLVQPNIAQDDKWRADNAENIFSTLIDLSVNEAEEKGVTHVVWPESSVPFLLDEDAVALARIGDMLRPGRTLAAGALRRERREGGEEPYFTSVLIADDEGNVRDVYDKRRLVPGGEFLPFEDVLSRLGFRKVVSLPESFTAGEGPTNLELPGIGKVRSLVCYEVIFPDTVVGEVRPRLLLNVTNDGWFGRSTGPFQHLAQARMRTIEQGLPMFRAANTGISAVIDPVGRILQQSTLGMQAVVDSHVPAALTAPIYSRFGDAMLCVLLIASLLLLRNTRLELLQLP